MFSRLMSILPKINRFPMRLSCFRGVFIKPTMKTAYIPNYRPFSTQQEAKPKFVWKDLGVFLPEKSPMTMSKTCKVNPQRGSDPEGINPRSGSDLGEIKPKQSTNTPKTKKESDDFSSDDMIQACGVLGGVAGFLGTCSFIADASNNPDMITGCFTLALGTLVGVGLGMAMPILLLIVCVTAPFYGFLSQYKKSRYSR